MPYNIWYNHRLTPVHFPFLYKHVAPSSHHPKRHVLDQPLYAADFGFRGSSRSVGGGLGLPAIRSKYRKLPSPCGENFNFREDFVLQICFFLHVIPDACCCKRTRRECLGNSSATTVQYITMDYLLIDLHSGQPIYP